MSDKKVYLLMIIAALFWSGAFIAGKLSTPFIPPFTLTFLRFFFATIIMYFIVKYTEGRIYRLKKSDLKIFLFTGIVGMFGYHVFFFMALKYTTAINSSIIGATNPIITTILVIIFLKDKISLKRFIGILLSFTGVILTITNASINILKNFAFNKGDILMLIAVFMWASYSVYSKKVIHKFTPIILTYYSFLFCTIFIIPFVLYEKPWTLLSSIPNYSYLAVLYMSIFPSVIGYLIQQMAIKNIGPSRASIFINLVPVFSIILSVIILKENISPIKLLTTLLIISGVFICQKN